MKTGSPWKNTYRHSETFRHERSFEKTIHSSRRTPESWRNIPILAIYWKLLDSREGPDDPFKLYRRAEAVVAPNLTKGVLQTAWSSLKKSLLRFRQDRRIEAAPLYTTRDNFKHLCTKLSRSLEEKDESLLTARMLWQTFDDQRTPIKNGDDQKKIIHII